DQLVPAGPRPGVDTGRPARSAAALDSAARATSAPAPASSGVAKAQAARAQAARSPRPATSPYGGTEGQPPASSYQTPALRRTYSPPIPAGARVCSAQVSDSPGGTHKRIDWCMTAAVTTTEAGHDLTVEVCRDQTTDSALSFDTTREADLVITRAGHEVWRWSVGHIAKPRTHALQTPAGACWSWTAPWTDVNGAGRPTPSGSYELVGTSLAGELADLPDVSTTFTIA
ncbi:MAG: Intracellular proteinase inhibitor, partial [Frankiales bacterium]|nr:Intracellular proteinase inhibitor [Frankiales bacterium]